MKVLHGIPATGEHHRNSRPVGETGLIVDTTPSAVHSLREIRDRKTGTADPRDDPVIDPAVEIRPIDSERSVPGILYPWSDSVVVHIVHVVTEPHGDDNIR